MKRRERIAEEFAARRPRIAFGNRHLSLTTARRHYPSPSCRPIYLPLRCVRVASGSVSSDSGIAGSTNFVRLHKLESLIDRVLLYVERGVLSEVQADLPLKQYRLNPTLDNVNFVVLRCNKCGEEKPAFFGYLPWLVSDEMKSAVGWRDPYLPKLPVRRLSEPLSLVFVAPTHTAMPS